MYADLMLRMVTLAWFIGSAVALEPTITLTTPTLEGAAIALAQRAVPGVSASTIREELLKTTVTRPFVFLSPSLDRQPYVALISERMRVYRALEVAVPILLQGIAREPGWDVDLSEAELILLWRVTLSVDEKIRPAVPTAGP